MNKNAEYYSNLMKYHAENGTIILNKDATEVFVPEYDEVFKQCYADTPTRKYFPKYWFVSDKGNVISFYHDKPVWIKKNQRESGSCCYKFMAEKEDGSIGLKNIEVHDLVALVFDSYVYGQAKNLLEADGIYAFGVHSKESNAVQGHHINSDHEDNKPKNIQLVTSDVHKLLHSAPTDEADDEKVREWEKAAVHILSNEEPDRISLVFLGECYINGHKVQTNDRSVHALDRIKFTERGRFEFNAMMQAMNEALNESKQAENF